MVDACSIKVVRFLCESIVPSTDNTLEPYILLHGSQVPGNECSANQLESEKQFGDHTSSCDTDMSFCVNIDVATKHT